MSQLGTLVPARASSKGCTIQQVEILSNKLLTTAFEATPRVPDRASSKGRAIRQVEILSNKLLTTAFEASLECVTVM